MSELHLPQGEARFVSGAPLPQGEARFVSGAHPPARGGEVRGLTSRKGRRGSWAHPPLGGEVRGLILLWEARFPLLPQGEER